MVLGPCSDGYRGLHDFNYMAISCYCIDKRDGHMIWGAGVHQFMNSMKLVIPLHSLYWSIHTKDESKRGTAFPFIFGVNWLWRCSVTASFGVFCSWNKMWRNDKFHGIPCCWDRASPICCINHNLSWESKEKIKRHPTASVICRQRGHKGITDNKKGHR